MTPVFVALSFFNKKCVIEVTMELIFFLKTTYISQNIID